MMWRAVLGGLALALVLPVVPAAAQDAQSMKLEMALKRKRHVVHPRIDTERMMREAVETAARIEAERREAELLREVRRPRPDVRPDLGYDVRQAVQQRQIQRVLRR